MMITAPDDYAGNPGSSITRNVVIVPPQPIEIASDPFAMSAISAVTITLPEDTDIIMINVLVLCNNSKFR